MKEKQENIQAVFESKKSALGSDIRKQIFESDNSLYKKFILAESPTSADLANLLAEIITLSEEGSSNNSSRKNKSNVLTRTEKNALEEIKAVIVTEIIGKFELHDNNPTTIGELIGAEDISGVLGKAASITKIIGNSKLPGSNQSVTESLVDLDQRTGDLSQLSTSNKASLVSGVNEVLSAAKENKADIATSKSDIVKNTEEIAAINSRVGSKGVDELETKVKSSLVEAINFLNTKSIEDSAKIAGVSDVAVAAQATSIAASAKADENAATLVNLKSSITIAKIQSGVFYPCFSADMADSGKHDGVTTITLKNPNNLKELILRQAQCDKWANSEQDIGYAESMGGECFLLTSIGDAAAKCRGAVIVAEDYSE